MLLNRRFCLVLVKPSHYDDDGYVIQWLRSPIPSNSLAALYGLAKDCAERHVLGSDVEIDVLAFDETNTRIRCDRLAAIIQIAGAGMVMLVGVQSNQFPRALDLAKGLRDRDIMVAIGGSHVSGTVSMLKGVDRDLECAKASGVALFAGEAEGRLEQVLQDAAAGALEPVCTENSVLVDCVNESPNVSGDDRSLMLPFELVVSPLKSESQLEAENAALRHQLIVLQRKVRRRVHLTNRDRLFLVQLYR